MATLDHRHLPADLIDRLLAGVLAPEAAAAASRAEQECDLCRQRLADARQAADLFLARHPPALRARELLDRAGRTRRRHLIVWALPALSAAAAVMLVLRGPLRPLPGPDDGILAKGGGPTLDFFVQQPGSAGPRPGRSGEPLRPGDTVQPALQLGRFPGVHVFSLDARGRTQPLFDWSPAAGGPPPALVLDGEPGTERIVALFHDLPRPEEALPRLRQAIAARYSGPDSPGLEAEPGAPPPELGEVAVRSILIRKEAPPSHEGPPGRL
jgi:hypothetical protein